MHNYPKRLTACLLLASHTLTSCLNPIVGPRKDTLAISEDLVTTKAIAPLALSQGSIEVIAKGGHAVALKQEADGLSALIKEDLPLGFERTLDLPVYGEPSLFDLSLLSQHSQSWYKRHIMVCLPEKDPKGKGYVYVGQLGLLGA